MCCASELRRCEPPCCPEAVFQPIQPNKFMAVISRGLEGIIAAETRIGDVRGDVGQLIYCGYDINELAGKVSYEEVVYLLWHNRLPAQRELDDLTRALHAERELPQG